MFNLAGVPGLVRDCDYDGTSCKARISVRVGQLFTVVRVNGLDVYFHRLTGSIDGIGLSPTFDCMGDAKKESIDLGVPPAD